MNNFTRVGEQVSPTVTVIVTVYKRTRYLHQALQSVLDQTFADYEIIVTDDSVCDEIRSICDSFNNLKIRYRTNTSTLGVALNLRAAISEAQGKYIAILNDDDAWEPEFLHKLVAPLEQDSCRVLSFSDHWIITEDGSIDRCKTDENTARHGRNTLCEGDVKDLCELVLEKNGVPLAMASVFRKDTINAELLVKDVSGAYDFWISCLLSASHGTAYYTPERLTRYRVHGGMETKRKAPDKHENMVYIYRRLIELSLFPDKTRMLQGRLSRALCSVGWYKLYFDEVCEARAHFIMSFKTVYGGKAIAGLLMSYLPAKVRSIVLQEMLN